jgi:fused signal recognition particle receptor
MFRKITSFGVVLALIIIVLGSYSRLSGFDPTLLNQNPVEVLFGNSHVYLTAALGLLIVLLSVMSWWQKCRLATVSRTLGLLVLVGLQGALAILAKEIVTMPIVVTVHLMLGMTTFWLLFGLYLRVNPKVEKINAAGETAHTGLGYFTRFAMFVLLLQIVLGAWVSTNHAALVCTGFPQCNGFWWPKANYQTALDLFHGFNSGYTGVIAFDAQVAANWLHRVGALFSFIVLSLVMLVATSALYSKPIKQAGLWVGVLLLLQISTGIIGVNFGAPLWAAAAHNTFALLLMLPLIAISFYSRYTYVEETQPAVKTKPKTVPVATTVDAKLEEAYVIPEPESLYLRLKTQLQRTRSGLGGVLAHIPLGQKEISGDLLEEIEASLLMADIGIDATTEIIRRLTESVERHQLNDGEALTAALKQELLGMLLPCSLNLQIPEQDKPFVILVVGVNGAGKTTTIGKLAKRLQAQGHSVMLAAGDTFRAAAVEQLQTWGERNNIHVVAQHTGADSASVIYDGVQSAQAKGIDVLIADTAGRLHTKSNLMDELKKVKRIIGKLDETAPHEVLLVLDAGTGQNALSQTRLFNETVALTGLVLTKLDGTAKGGIIFALAKQFKIPIRYIGIGEGIDDLQDFDAEAFVNALFVKD